VPRIASGPVLADRHCMALLQKACLQG
jgi:hypothetical protein